MQLWYENNQIEPRPLPNDYKQRIIGTVTPTVGFDGESPHAELHHKGHHGSYQGLLHRLLKRRGATDGAMFIMSRENDRRSIDLASFVQTST